MLLAPRFAKILWILGFRRTATFFGLTIRSFVAGGSLARAFIMAASVDLVYRRNRFTVTNRYHFTYGL
jgi:hypothetical protein